MGPLNERVLAERKPATKARLAITLLHLNARNYLETPVELLALTADPIQRTAFIHAFETWHADPADYDEFFYRIDSDQLQYRTYRIEDSAFRSGLTLGVGLIRDPGREGARESLSPVLLEMYQLANDATTHSASGWTLRQWEIALPEIAVDQASSLIGQAGSPTYAGGRDWFINSQGQTMIKISTGTFTTRGG